MGSQQPTVRIAINVMRARLTVVGFNLAIITFQLAQIGRLPGGVRLPDLAMSIHLQFDIALFIGLGLSILAMVSFIASGAFDLEATCSHWSLLSGDLLMYLGLAHSVAGLFGPLIQLLDPIALATPREIEGLSTTVRMAVLMVGGSAWLAATYIGPTVSLLRSPFGWRVTTALGVAYLLLLLSLAHVSAQAVSLEAARAGIEASPSPHLLIELLQPLRW